MKLLTKERDWPMCSWPASTSPSAPSCCVVADPVGALSRGRRPAGSLDPDRVRGGVFLMRSAGCVINDYADRNFDGHVKRTAGRPLPMGRSTRGRC